MKNIRKLVMLFIGLFALILPGCGGGDDTANPFSGDLSGGASKTTRTITDTGQTTDYTAIYGEDSDYIINPMSFTANGDGTITDNVTELMWQQQDDGVNYNWYEASGISETTKNPAGVVDVCGDLNLGSYNDWRLPSINELISIVNLNAPNPTIDTNFFPNTISSSYWSSQPYNNASDILWFVDFSDATINNTSVSNSSRYVRCVRGSHSPVSNFSDNGDATIKDNVTGLIWQQTEGGLMNWDAALNYCESLILAGNSDWRLPNYKELSSLIDYSRINPAIDTAYFPGTQASFYWSSSTTLFSGSHSLDVDFYDGFCPGYINWVTIDEYGLASGHSKADKVIGSQNVRCVR